MVLKHEFHGGYLRQGNFVLVDLFEHGFDLDAGLLAPLVVVKIGPVEGVGG